MASARAEELIRFTIASLVDEPEAVVVASAERDGETVFEVTVAPDDAGKVIGKQGRIIKAVRILARAAGALDGVDVHVEVLG